MRSSDFLCTLILRILTRKREMRANFETILVGAKKNDQKSKLERDVIADDSCYITYDPISWTWNFAQTECGFVISTYTDYYTSVAIFIAMSSVDFSTLVNANENPCIKWCFRSFSSFIGNTATSLRMKNPWSVARSRPGSSSSRVCREPCSFTRYSTSTTSALLTPISGSFSWLPPLRGRSVTVWMGMPPLLSSPSQASLQIRRGPLSFPPSNLHRRRQSGESTS